MPGQTGGLCSIAFAALACGALLGCSHKSEPASATSTGAIPPPPFAKSPSEDSYEKQDPCNLLDPKEVEAALGAPLATPPYRSGNATYGPAASGSECVYETAKFRYITLDVTYEGGAQQYSMTGMVKGLMKSGGGKEDIANNVKKNFRLDDGTDLSGEWDEASLMPMNCCIFSGLRGDQLITIDFTASPATLRQAATLMDSAYKRMEQPLKIDGGGGVTAAKTLNSTRPKPTDVCSLLTRAEVEAILGKLLADPVPHGHDGCTYKLPSQGIPQEYEVSIRWGGGYYQWRSDRYVNSIGGGAVHQIAADVLKQMGHPLPEQPAQSHDEADSGSGSATAGDPAESVSDNGMNFVVVKRDVQVSVNNRFVDPERAKALVAAVAAKTDASAPHQ
jgi:hypothetical protein